LKVAFLSSEVVPFSKTGGLADVAGSLPQALEHQKCEVVVITPKYKTVKVDGNKTKIGKNIWVYFIENKEYFGRDNLYGTKHGDYEDNLDRFAFYCKKSLDLLKEINFKPDIIHCNDWQTSLIPVFLKTIYKYDSFFARTKTVLTIHNLAYQGLFKKEELEKTGLGQEVYNVDMLEFYDKLNILKGGLVFSDVLTTVSPTYAKEIQTKEFGCGVEGLLQKRAGDIYGIINGIDYSLWSPQTDEKIFKKYSKKDIENKYVNKEMLQKETRMEINKNIPLIGTISRLADQKGFDLISEIIEEVLNMKVQFILLGTGEAKYHELFEEMAKKFPKETSINLRFDAVLAQRIYAGCDMFLMPSYYEPCGLGQLISLKYGTIPIVRKTGGLADTIENYDPVKGTGNGFVFTERDSKELLNAIKRPLALYENKKSWRKLVEKAMEYDFSWDSSAKEYIKVYNIAVGK